MKTHNDQNDSQQIFEYILNLINHIQNKRMRMSFVIKDTEFKKMVVVGENRQINIFLSKKDIIGRKKEPQNIFIITNYSYTNDENNILFEDLRRENQQRLLSFFEEVFLGSL